MILFTFPIAGQLPNVDAGVALIVLATITSVLMTVLMSRKKR